MPLNPAGQAGPHLRVYQTPAEVPRGGVAGSTVIVVDLLRASTTILTALEAGAVAVRPFAQLEQARQAAAASRPAEGGPQPLLAGERNAIPPPGFDLGNSPLEYTPQRVAGRTILFTSTNGTAALCQAVAAQRVLVGCLRNRAAVARAAASAPSDSIQILCAGTDGHPTSEDLFAAGAIAEAVLSHGPRTLGGAAAEALALWGRVTQPACEGGPAGQIADWIRSTPHGQTLAAAGFEADIDFCSQLDLSELTPAFDPTTGLICRG